ncbi:putative PurR-regulated permease PerM [Paenibacillus turicensis]|uniref:PurR-regulated permease PerM n=1 Tax=Paenibacillus turicensis TaxID=160487 RepID=A0ABS4FR14_9BACL|nr:AI-2E family transporter [Paenibacillus turicensis]MBP1904844.1 putative PurR-regulated permease PerM [Paenibacillus turicensis]
MPIHKTKLFQTTLWILLAMLILFFGWMLRPMFGHVYDFFKAILAPFIVAMIISYVLNPIVRTLGGRKVPRTIAVLLIYAVFLVIVAVILINLIPMIIKQLGELDEHLPKLTMHTQQVINEIDHSSMPGGIRMGLTNWFFGLEQKFAKALSDFMNNIGATIEIVFNAFIVPFLIFYILKDFQFFEDKMMQFLPRAHRKPIVRLMKEIDDALGSYVRGQLLVCVIIGIFAYIGYIIIGMPFALLLAGVVSICNIIPYIGPFLGAAPALVMAVTMSWKQVLLVIVVNCICQTVESNIVSPQVVGRSLQLHPMMIIFALLVGGEVGGVVGLILAVPFFAVCKVVIQHVFVYYIRRKSV